MKKRSGFKAALVLASGGMVFGSSGNCLPDNFWMTQWDNTLTSTVDTLVSATLASAIVDAFDPADAEE